MARFNKISAVLKQNIKARCQATEKSKEQYISVVDRFGAWVEQREGTQRVNPDRYHELIQTYINERTRTVSAQTVNKDLASLVNGTREHKQDYIHPKRNEAPTKGRQAHGITKEGKPTAAGIRLYNLAKYIGIREREYLQLRGRDIKTDKHGLTYVYVTKGKGGKSTWQLVSPAHAKEVQQAFKAVQPDSFVFTKQEVRANDHSNLHGLRREHAREVYKWFMEQPRTVKDSLMNEVRQRFAENPKKAERNEWQRVADRIRNSPVIMCRGHNATTLKAQGRSTEFDREAVIFTSVVALSHFREDVTVSNYLV